MARYSFSDVADGQTLPAARIMELQQALESGIEPYSRFYAPATSGWSWTNQGTASVAQDANGEIKMTLPTAAGDNWRLYTRTPAATSNYEWTVFLQPTLHDEEHQWTGMILRQSSDGKIISFGYARTAGLVQLNLLKWNSATSYNSDYERLNLAVLLGEPMWLKIADDGTNRIFQISPDGLDFVTVFSVGRTDFLTPDQFGFGGMNQVTNRTTYLNLRSWREQ